jgi:hypothetical protein
VGVQGGMSTHLKNDTAVEALDDPIGRLELWRSFPSVHIFPIYVPSIFLPSIHVLSRFYGQLPTTHSLDIVFKLIFA